MLHVYAFLNAFVAEREEKGATATEYALIIAGIAVAIVAAIGVFGGQLSTFWSGLGSKLKL
ncbi:Flp family type IVb pilin [Aeromicrobium sp. 636]|uniref:Flp family type IVb pilin n=1 Tax=Aeromicrobium senzhongii TaxID=2663859 RepID=A0A8I0EVG3_9ACTN|nr:MULTISPECIES: Flp family type IVb pilin [Aeromicrobium]MBC9226353.1 Flp family type IVb pilin [Aeromicrobium senzhongii]MCQ3998458.1 Flp family type IVb pilin [Aeromicrobium sp. 636]